MITLADLSIGKFRQGQWSIDEAKHGETLALVNDGDVTTYAYSLPDYVSRQQFEILVGAAFGKIGEEDEFTIVYQ